MGLELFKVHVASQDTVKSKAVDGILCLIESERYDTHAITRYSIN